MSSSSSRCHRQGRRDIASRTTLARSSARRRSSISGPCDTAPLSSTSSWLGTTLLRAARQRRHSFRAVAASQDPTRSGYSIRSMCSSSRSQVVWATSAASLSTSLKSHGNGPDQPRVLINQAFPRLVIPVGGTPHQRRHIEDAEILVEHRRQLLSPISDIETRSAARQALVRTGTTHEYRDRLPHDLQVQGERPVLHVPQVEPD